MNENKLSSVDVIFKYKLKNSDKFYYLKFINYDNSSTDYENNFNFYTVRNSNIYKKINENLLSDSSVNKKTLSNDSFNKKTLSDYQENKNHLLLPYSKHL